MSKYDVKVALLGNTIDYAGTFPPAALSLEKALERAALFRRSSYFPWLLSKVAVTVTDLKKINSKLLYELGALGEPWVFTALGNSSTPSTREEWVKTVEWDVREVVHWNEKASDSSCQALTVNYESPIPLKISDESPETISAVLERFFNVSQHALSLSLEVSLDGAWKSRLEKVADTIVRWLDENQSGGPRVGVKIRTGGSFRPSIEAVAKTIETCVSRRLRFKATQGLHDVVTQSGHLGFLNLFAALAFAQALGLKAFPFSMVASCLDCSAASDFSLSGEVLCWRNFKIDSDQIESTRRHLAACFGSCSLDEPDASLKAVFP